MGGAEQLAAAVSGCSEGRACGKLQRQMLLCKEGWLGTSIGDLVAPKVTCQHWNSPGDICCLCRGKHPLPGTAHPMLAG